METAAKLSSKLEQNTLQRQQQKQRQQQLASSQTSSSGFATMAAHQQPNLHKIQSSKIGANGIAPGVGQLSSNEQRLQSKHQSERFATQKNQAQASNSIKPLKRLLNTGGNRINLHQTSSAEDSGSQSINLVAAARMMAMQNSSVEKPISSDAESESGPLTQMQIYNRIQQAKLLGRHSNKFPTQMPEIKKRNATLSNLLRYPSPKGADRQRGNLLPAMTAPLTAHGTIHQQQKNRVEFANVAPSMPVSQSMVIEPLAPQQQPSGPAQRQVQVRIDGGQTQIFRDPKSVVSAISPIISEGSQYSNDDVAKQRQDLMSSLVKKQLEQDQDSFTMKAYEIMQLTNSPDSNQNILIRDFNALDFIKKQEPPIQHKLATANMSLMSQEANDIPTKKQLAAMIEQQTREMKVHGIHQNNQKLFFDTKQEEGTGKTLITVPLAKLSKFGPAAYQKKEKEYRLVMLNDRELDKAMSDNTKLELSEIAQIQRKKEEVSQEVYFEDIMTFPIELRCQKDRNQKKRRNLEIGQKLQEEREQMLWERREQKVLAQLKKQQRMGAEPVMKQKSEENEAGAAGMAMGGHFDYMNIDELKQHENGILNLFEGEKNIARYVSHNKPGLTRDNVIGQRNKKYVRLSQLEYETIFEKDPSFNEKKAFVEVFRKKWKEDKGYCSMFDKRSKYRKAKSAFLSKRDREMAAHSKFKNRKERQMLLNYRDKVAQKQQELREKQEIAESHLQAAKEKDKRAATLLFKKALRRTRSKSPIRTRMYSTEMARRPQVKQAENYESNMFPLTKTDSLEEIMLMYSSKTQQLGMSAVNFGARAKSAVPLGGRKSIASMTIRQAQQRVESSQVPQVRDFSAKPTTLADVKSDTEEKNEMMNLHGKQAMMHQPLQNHDDDYLSNFITQMYQTTTMYNKLPTRALQEHSAAASQDGTNKLDPILVAQNSSGAFNIAAGKDTVDENNAEGTQGSIVQLQQEKLGNEANTGRLSYRQATALNSQHKDSQPGMSQLHDNDIKIVTLPSKERVHVMEHQKGKKDLLLIQSQLDSKMLSFTVTRDPRSAKTLPNRKPLLLGQKDEGTGRVQYHVQKTIFSHREKDFAAKKNSSQGQEPANGMQIEINTSVHSEKKAREQNQTTTMQLTVEQKLSEPLNANQEVHLMNTLQKTNRLTSSGPPQREPNQNEGNVYSSIQVSRVFQSGEDHHGAAILNHQRKSQLTDSKDSKLSDDPDMIHDHSLMQPKNNRRDSFEESSKEQAFNAIVNKTCATNGSKDRAPGETEGFAMSAGFGSGSFRQHEKPSFRSNRVSKDVKTLDQTRNNANNPNNYMDINSMNSGTRRDENAAMMSRQNRVTVNSSYRSRPTNENYQRVNSGVAGKEGDSSFGGNYGESGQAPGSGQQTSNAYQREPQIKNPLSQDQVSSNQDLMMHISGSNTENPFDEWTKPQDGNMSSKLELLLKNTRPSVYDLPQNPMNYKSYKCNYIKARVETTRMDFIHSQNQKLKFKVENAAAGLNGTQTSQAGLVNETYGGTANQDLALNGSGMLKSTSALTGSFNRSGTFIGSTKNSSMNKTRAMSANRPVSNAYLRNQKLVQMRKKEQQFCYYLQQHRQNKQLLESLEKQALQAQNASKMLAAVDGHSRQLIMTNQLANVDLQVAKHNNRAFGQGRAKTQLRLQPNKTAPRNQNIMILTPSNQNGYQDRQTAQGQLVISGTSGLRSAKPEKNQDINTRGVSDHQTTIDPAWLETNSPHNREFIEKAYQNYNRGKLGIPTNE